MNEYFSKFKDKSEIKTDLVDLETVEQQLKSMKLAYIKTGFILKDMEQEFEKWHKENIEDSSYSEEELKKAEELALKQVKDPNFYQGEVMKNTPTKIAQCVQVFLMLKNKKDEIEAKRDEWSVVARNIDWLKELLDSLQNENSNISEENISITR